MTLDQQVIDGYFNKHDPAPIYKRQLSHQFERYILDTVATAKRYDVIFYKFKCTNENDKQYAEPLMYAVHRHFSDRKTERMKEFVRFKQRNWILLAVGIVVAIICQGFLPLLFKQSQTLHTGLINSLDIFAWVLLWHPIDELIFHWNPYLKDIHLLEKLGTAESIIIENEKRTVANNDPMRVVA
ncbi:hypothetical protein [uncultured Mucilaginibacter sp.]|uniref:hypothetical protein n=1 Tax=uncultured Mucilaginibacter sp. TaxID=797541 RepID=UPI002610A5EC|nr:hypothetical protein [uncultured Mucilaginibacter sp.]